MLINDCDIFKKERKRQNKTAANDAIVIYFDKRLVHTKVVNVC
jgi:hypothetical protein